MIIGKQQKLDAPPPDARPISNIASTHVYDTHKLANYYGLCTVILELKE